MPCVSRRSEAGTGSRLIVPQSTSDEARPSAQDTGHEVTLQAAGMLRQRSLLTGLQRCARLASTQVRAPAPAICAVQIAPKHERRAEVEDWLREGRDILQATLHSHRPPISVNRSAYVVGSDVRSCFHWVHIPAESEDHPGKLQDREDGHEPSLSPSRSRSPSLEPNSSRHGGDRLHQRRRPLALAPEPAAQHVARERRRERTRAQRGLHAHR